MLPQLPWDHQNVGEKERRWCPLSGALGTALANVALTCYPGACTHGPAPRPGEEGRDRREMPARGASFSALRAASWASHSSLLSRRFHVLEILPANDEECWQVLGGDGGGTGRRSS